MGEARRFRAARVGSRGRDVVGVVDRDDVQDHEGDLEGRGFGDQVGVVAVARSLHGSSSDRRPFLLHFPCANSLLPPALTAVVQQSLPLRRNPAVSCFSVHHIPLLLCIL